MAVIGTTQIADALKDYYLPGLRTQINDESDVLWAQMEKTTELVSGENVVLSLRYGRTGGTGARAETGTLPTPNPRKSLKATFDTKNLFSRMQIYEKPIRRSGDDRGSFARMFEQSLEDLLTDAKDQVQRQVYGDGTGKITTVTTVDTSTTKVVASVAGLFEGMLIDILDSAGSGIGAAPAGNLAGEITAVDDATNTITLAAAAKTDATTNIIVTAGSYGLELTGLDKVFTADNTLYGVVRTTYPMFNPTTQAISGEISEVGIQTGLDKAWQRTGATHDFLLGSLGVQRAWMNLMIAFRGNNNTLALKGGWTAPATYQNGNRGGVIPFMAGKYAPAQKLRALSLQNWMVAWYGDWEWMDRDGNMMSRIADKNGYEATLQLFAEICCDLPKGQVDFTSITEH